MKIFLLSKTIFIIRTNYNLNTAIMSFTLIASPSPIRKQEYIFFNVPPKREKKETTPFCPLHLSPLQRVNHPRLAH